MVVVWRPRDVYMWRVRKELVVSVTELQRCDEAAVYRPIDQTTLDVGMSV